jgi:hypothetical protein
MPEKLEFWIVGKDRFSKVGAIVGRSLRGLRTAGLAAAAGATAAGAALVAITNSTAKAGDEFQKMGLKTGVSAETLSAWSHAAELSGSNMQAVGVGLRTIAKRMNDANIGLETYVRSFDALGVSFKKADGSLREVDAVMLDAADAISKMEDNTKAAALAQELFGRGGAELLPMLKQGAAGIKAMEEEARLLGITFSQTAADMSANFVDNMTRLQRVVTGVKNQIGQALMPILIDLQKVFIGVGIRIVAWAKENREAIQQMGVNIITIIGSMAERVAIAVGWMIDAWNGLKSTWLILRVALNDFVTFYYGALDAIADKIIWFLEVMEQVPLIGEKFEGITAAVRWFRENTKVALELVAQDNEKLLNSLAEQYDKGPAREAIRKFIEDFKASLASLKEEGTFEGMPAFLNPEKVGAAATQVEAKVATTIANLQAQYDQYFLTEEERLVLWYEKQKELLANQHAELLMLEELYQAKKLELEVRLGEAESKARLKEQKDKKKRLGDERKEQLRQYDSLLGMAQTFGVRSKYIEMARQIPSTIRHTYEGAIKAYNAMAGIPIVGPALGAIAAAAVVAFGMASLAKVRSAHGGLTEVPREQAYMLAPGERVVSGEQNRDLTEFLAEGAGAGITVENLNVEVMPNATNPEALLAIDEEDWREIALDRILPALRNLKTEGYAI